MPTTPSSPAGRARGDGALAGIVRRAASASARRPRTMIVLWFLLVVGCFVAGGLAGTKELSGADAGVGASARADKQIVSAKLPDRVVESVLVRSGDGASTAAAARALETRLRHVPEVAAVRGPRDTPSLSRVGGRTVLVQAQLRGSPDDASDHVAGVALPAAVALLGDRGWRVRRRAPGRPQWDHGRPAVAAGSSHGTS